MTNRHASTKDVFLSGSASRPERSEDDETFERAENLLTSRLAKMQREIRRVDLFTACCSCATLALAVMFVGVLCDGWIFSDGLSVRGRGFFVVLLLVVAFLSFFWKVAPILGRRINALYAAKALEDAQQDKHNLTINWLQLCHADKRTVGPHDKDAAMSNEQAQEVRRKTLQIVALQAARLSKKTSDETAVDCSSLIRWGIALACLSSLCAVYTILSPKNPFVSAERIVAPTALIERPQALRFDEVTPGDAVVFQGDFLEIEAVISGAKPSEKVEVLWETEDGRISNVAIPMEPVGSSRFKATLPDVEKGFSENLNYRVVAGRGSRFESSSDLYHATVRPQPSFRVEKTTLKFPSYTGLPSQTFENQGDVRAVENTTVEIVARATEKLTRAYLLPDGDQTRAIKMSIHPEEPEIASASFILEWNDNERRRPLFSTYTLLSEDVENEKNRDAQVYNVSILADQPPTIRWESDSSEVVQVPLNDVLRISFVAEDPDYSIRRAELHVAHGTLQQGDQADQKPNPRPIDIPLSSDSSKIDPQGPTPYVGPQTLRYALVPEKLGLGVGDELEFWGVVFDSKTPEPNVSVCEKRVFVVVNPVDSPSDPNDVTEEEPAQNDNSDEGTGANSSSKSNERGGEGTENSHESDGQNDDDNQNAGSNQQNSHDQNTETSQSADANEQTGNGSDTNEASSSDANGQNQDDAESETGTGADSATEGEQHAGSEQNSSADGTETTGTDTANSSTDSPSEGDSTSSEGAPDATNMESKEGSNSSGTAPHNNPDDGNPSQDEAFQKILDFMNASQNSSTDEGNEPNATGNGDSNEAKGSNQQGNNQDETDDTEESQHEVEPHFEPSDNLSKPREEKKLPTRTSSEKPSEDAPSYRAENPDKIDPNSRRRQGDVDPNANDFLAQNADPNQPESPASSKNPRDRNITLDPLDQSQGTSADAVDQNAPEAKGSAGNVPEGGTTEVDRNETGTSGQSSTSNQPHGQPEDAPQSTTETDGQNNSDEQLGTPGVSSGGDSNSSENQSSTNRKGKTPSSGGADDLGAAHGGGGAGSGLGEIEQGEEQLAPADAPRLQFAEKATNLVLEYLEDSLKDSVDRRLLKELNWTEEEARAFLEQWKRMRDAASQDDKARDKYLEALKNVELDDYASLDDSDSVDSTVTRDSHDSRPRAGSREFSRLKTPDRLSERVRAFTRGVSSGSEKR